MNQLKMITTNENLEPIISGRDLHEFLEENSKYNIEEMMRQVNQISLFE